MSSKLLIKHCLLILLGIILPVIGLSSQSRLISNDPPNNIYSITFTDLDQKVLVVHFDDFVTSEGTTAGWTVLVGGVSVPLSGAPTRSGTTVSLELSSPISYTDRNNVFVSYSAASGSLSLFSGSEPDFTNVQAYNNHLAVPSDFTNGLYGENPPKDICAGVEDVEVEMNLILSARYRNSIHYSTPRAYIRWQSPNDNPKSQPFFVETSPGTGVYNVVSTYSGYPENTINCTWEISIFPYLYNSGTLQPNLFVTQNRVFIVIPNYKKDDGTPAPGTGSLGIDPPLDDLRTLFCVGEDIEDFVFDETVEFDCRYGVENELPNINTRWVQFVYGTHGSAIDGIPNVFIDVNGTPVQVTDADGNGIIQKWFVNPDGTPNAAGYFTASGYFEGPVEEYDFNTTEPYSLIDARISTYPINHTGDFTNDQVDDIFEITLNVWGPCNPYGTSPVSEISRLRLVESPPPPTVPTLTECVGSVTATINASGTGGVIQWFDDPRHRDPTDLVNTGGSFTHGKTINGTYTWWVTESRDYGSGVSCPSDTSRSTLTINPIPNKPSIVVTGSPNFCYDGGTTNVTLTADPNDPPTVTSYQWYRNGTAIGGATSSSIVLDEVAESGTYTVRTLGINPTNCESPLSDPQVINIYELATTTDPADQTICADNNVEDGNASFSVTVGGAPRTIQWQRSNDGSTWVDITGATSPGDGCSYGGYNTATLSITGADYAMNGYQYRVKLSTTAGGCETLSAAATLTVHPTATISPQPADQNECEFDNASFTIGHSIAAGSVATYQWQREGTNITATTDGGVYSGYNTQTLTITAADRSLSGNHYRVYITSNEGCRTRSDFGELSINPKADITSHPANQEICENKTASFSVSTDGDPVVTGYRWELSTNGGTSWSDVTGGGYSEEDTPTLSITNVPISYNGNLYRVVLTTGGGCDITSNNGELTVNPEPVERTIVSSGNNICYNTSTNVVILSSVSGVLYSVYDASDDSFVGSVNGNGGDVTVATPNLTAASSTFYVVARNTSTSCERRNNDEVTINVNPQFVLAALAEDGSICMNDSYDFRVNMTGGTGPYDLTYSDGSNNYPLTNYVSGSTINTGPLTGNTTYSLVSVVDDRGCPADDLGSDISVTVGAAYVSATITAGADVCEGSDASIRLQSAGGAPPYTYTLSGDNIPGTLNVTSNDTTVNIAGLTVGNHSYTLVSAVDHCANAAGSIINSPDGLEVFGLPDISGTTNNATTVCNDGITDIELITDVPGTEFSWTITAGLGASWSAGKGPVAGSMTDAAGTETIAQQLQHSGPEPVTVSYRIASKGPGATACPGNSVDMNVVVPPTPVVTSPATKSVCNSTALGYDITSSTTHASLSFEWSRAAVSGISNGAVTGQTADPINESLTNTTNEPIDVEYVITPKIMGCDGVPFTLTVTVNPTATVNSANSYNLCDNTAMSYTATSPTTHSSLDFSWTRAAVSGISPATGTGTGALIDEVLDNSTTEPIDVEYIITPEVNGCPGTAFTLTVTVNPTPVVNSASSVNICDNSLLNYTITSSTTDAALSFNWSRPLVSGIANPAAGNTGSSISETLDNTTTEPIVVPYTITPEINACTGTPFTLNVTVNPTTTVTSPATASICNSTALGYTITSATTDAALQFNWSRAAVAGISNTAASATSNSINESLTNTTTEPIDVAYSITPTINGCPGTPFVLTVTVNPTPVVTSPATKMVCDLEAIDYSISSSTTDAGLVFNWSRAAVAGISNGAVSNTGNYINESLDNTSTEPVDVEYVITPRLNGCDGTPFTLTVTVNPTPVVTSAATLNICNNTALGYTITSSTSDAALGFEWERAAVTGISNTAVSGQSANPINEALVNTTTEPVNVSYVITPIISGCDGTPFTLTVTVNPTAVITSPTTAMVCDNVPLAYTITSSTTDAALVLNWSRAAVTGIQNSAAAGTGSLINESLDNTSTEPVDVEYVITPSINGCTGTPLTLTVKVNPTPVLTSPTTMRICDDTPLGYTITSSTSDAALNFNWSRNSVAGIANAAGSGTGASINETLDNTWDIDIDVLYTITPVINGCNGIPGTLTATVEPTPKATVTNTTATVCNEGNVDITISSATVPSVPANLTFDVEVSSTDDANLGGAASADLNDVAAGTVINGQLTNASYAPIVVTYTITPKLSACPAGSKVTTQVTVYPKPDVTATNNTPVLPTGATTDIVLNGNVAGTTFGWHVPNPGTTGAADGGGLTDGQSIAQLLTNTSAVPVTVTYRIAPMANGCPGDSITETVQIDPNVDMTVVNNAPDICTGGSSDLDISSSVAGATFAWTVTDANGAGATAGSGGPNTHTIQQSLVNTTSAPISVSYHITPTGPAPTFIAGTTQDHVVTIYPKPQGQISNNAPRICNGSDTDIDLDSDVSGTTFTWTITDPSGASGASASTGSVATGNTIAQTLVNAGTTPLTVTYHILPTGPNPTNCNGDILDIDVIVDPTPVANISNAAPVICSGTNTNIGLNASVANSSFTWSVADPKGTGATGGTGLIGDAIVQTLSNTTQSPVSISYEIIPYGPGTTACPGSPVYQNVTVNPLPITSAITGADTVCEGTTNLVFSVVHTPDSYYEWNVPAVLGTPTFGGSGLNSYATIITAANTAAMLSDSLWVFETNQYGCTRDTIYKPLTIVPFPTVANITGDASVCALTTHSYSVPNQVGSNYQWFIPPGAGFGSSDPTTNSIDVTFGLISGQVRAIETSSGGCVTTHNPLMVTVNPLPIATLNADRLAACEGDVISFTAGPASGTNFEFFVNGTSVQSGASNTYAVSSLANNDVVTVNVTSADGCEQLSGPVQITIYAPPVVSLASSDADNIICFGENVDFTATSATAVSYEFFLNGASVQNGPLNFWSSASLNDGDEVYAEVRSAFSCFGRSDTIQTVVNPLPVASLSGDNTICPGDASDLSVTVTTGLANYTVSIDNGVGTINNYASGDPIPVSPALSTTYKLVSLSDANGCTSAVLTPSAGNLSGTATVSVRDTVQILTQPHDALVCEAVDTSFSVFATGEGLSYEWQVTSNLADPWNLIPGATSPIYPVIAPSAALDSFYYRVRVYSTLCPEFAFSDTVQLFLKYDPALTSQPADQTICEGEGTGFSVDAGLTTSPLYQWQLSYDNGSNWLNLSDTAVYNGTSTDSMRVISASSRFNNYRYRAVVTGECGTPVNSNMARLTILERPEILEHPHDTTVCETQPLSFSVNAGVTTGVSYQWEVDMGSGFVVLGDTAGIYSGTGSNLLQVLNPVSRFNGYQYRVGVSGSCPVALYSNPALLMVNEVPEILAQPTDTIICENESPFFFVNSGATSAPVYQWQVSIDNGNSWDNLGDTAIYTGSSSHTLRLTGVPSTYDQYRYRAIVSGVCAPAVSSTDVLLTVRERPEILSHPSDTSVCEGLPARFDVNAGLTSNASYQWQVNMNEGSGFLNIESDTAGVYQGSSQASLQVLSATSRFNGYQYRVIVSGDCSPPQTSNFATLSVPEVPEITLQPVDREICEENNTFFQVSAGVTSNPVYQWQVNMNDGNGFVDIGADTGVYTSVNSPNLFLTMVPSSYNGYRYHVRVSGQCNPPVVSNDVLLTVNELPEISTQPVNDTVCEGDAASFTVATGVTTGAVVQWQVNRTGLWENLDDVSGDYTGSATNVLSVNNPGSAYMGYRYRARISGICAPPVLSEAATLIIDERPEILAQPTDKAICEDDNVFFVVHAGATTTPTYYWEYSTDGTTWAAANTLPEYDREGDTLFLSALPSSYDGHHFRATVGGKCSAPVVSNVAKLTVYEKPQLDLQPVDVVACEQDSVLFFVDAGPTSMPNYQWEIWNGATWIVPPVDIYSGSNNDTLWINGVHSGINGLQIRLRLNGICAPGVISDTAVLTVDERPEIVSQPADLTICENDNASFGIDAGVSTSPLYRWQYFDGSNWQDAGGGFFSGETSDTLRLTGVPSTWTATGFRAIVSNACGPNDTSQVATLTVYERPEILLQPSDAETCEGVGTSFSIDPGVTTNPGYLWQVHNGVFWAPVTGFNYSGQGTPLLSILNPGSAMNGYAYRVTLSGSCSDPVVSDSVSLTIRENPEIVLQPVSAEICELQDTSFTVDPGVTTNPNFIWYYNDGSGSWQPVPSDAVHSGVNTNTLVLTNVPWSQNNWQYRVEVSGSCGTPVSSNPASLRVHKLPEIVSQPRDTTICELMNAAFTIDVGNTGSPLIQWEEYDGSGWQAISDGGNYIGSGTEELNIYAIDSAMTGFRYRARVQGYCSPGALSNEAVLTVHSAPQLWKQPLDATICEGDNTSFSVQATGTNLSYQWQVDMGSGFTDISDSNGGVFAGWNSPTLVLTGADRSFDISRYRVRVEGSCAPAQVSNLAVLMVRTPAEIQDQPDPLTICEFKNATFSVNASGAGLSYQWQESTTGGASWTDMNDLGLTIGTQTPNMGMFSVSRSFDTNRYRVIVTGTCGVPVISDAPELRVETAPEILRQPIDTTVCELTAAGFKVEARGTNISYHWQVNDGSGFTDIPVGDPMYEGELSDSLTLLNAQLAHSGYSFRVVISGNCIPPATSNPVILLVNPNVVINVDTEADAICENGSTTFSVDASGVGLSYQWMVNRNDGNGFVALTDDANHLGSNDEQLVVSNVTLDMDGWSYYLDVLSVCNPISSASATLTVWPNPVPAITPLTTHPDYPLICGGDLLTLDGNPSGGSGNYTIHQWSGAIAPLSSISDRVVDFRTTIKGIYELAYKVTDDRGCVGTSVVTIENERPTAQFLSDAVPSCGYREVNFTNASTADAATFLWDFGDGNTSTQKDVSHGFDNTSPSGEVAYYTVKLVAASEHNCRDTARSVVTIYPKVVANIDADTTEGCHPLNLVFTTQPGAASYLWDYGDGNGAEGGYVTQHLFENYGTSVETYTVELTTTSFYGCIDTATLDVTVQPIPQPSFTAVPLVQTYPDATVTFTNGTQAGPWTYLWDFGDGSTSTEENPVHVYASDGTYSVVFYVNSGDCIDSTGTTVVIHPQPPLADFEIPESGCTPLEVRFTNLSKWATNYLWDFGDGYVSTEENPSHTFEYPGEMTVRLQATGPGGTANSSAILNVYETPNVAFNSAPDSVFVKDKPVRFFNLTAGATNYRWDFGDYYEDGEAAPYNFSSATDTLHYYYTEGYKDVKLVAWNDHCIDSLTKQVVKVIPAGDIQFPTVFRPDLSGPSGGYIDPNNPNTDPGVANSIFYPGINKQVDEYHLYVYNRWGELIFQSDDINVGWDGYIKGQLAAQGVYIWKVLLVYKNGSPESLAGDITLLWKREQ